MLPYLLLAILMPVIAVAQAPRSASDVSLAPGDVVKLEVWQEEDLSGEFLVDEDGQVTLPLLGPVDVSGIPVRQLRARLIEAYRVQLQNPSITVTPLRRVLVLGEVHEPGVYNVDPTISLAGAIALAGGATPGGDLRRLRVVRDGVVVKEGATAEGSLAANQVLSGDQIFVERRSWFDRNSTFLVSAMLSVTSIVISILR